MPKTSFKKEDIQQFLSKKYNIYIELRPVVEGIESQVYSYNYNGQEYIIRINPLIEGFKKDEYAYKHFNSELIPIPKIIEYEKFINDNFYCISEKEKE